MIKAFFIFVVPFFLLVATFVGILALAYKAASSISDWSSTLQVVIVFVAIFEVLSVGILFFSPDWKYALVTGFVAYFTVQAVLTDSRSVYIIAFFLQIILWLYLVNPFDGNAYFNLAAARGPYRSNGVWDANWPSEVTGPFAGSVNSGGRVAPPRTPNQINGLSSFGVANNNWNAGFNAQEWGDEGPWVRTSKTQAQKLPEALYRRLDNSNGNSDAVAQAAPRWAPLWEQQSSGYTWGRAEQDKCAAYYNYFAYDPRLMDTDRTADPSRRYYGLCAEEWLFVKQLLVSFTKILVTLGVGLLAGIAFARVENDKQERDEYDAIEREDHPVYTGN